MNNDFWRNKNVLITGHTGFKGSWLSLWLKQLGANICGLSLADSVSNPDMFSVLSLEDSIHDVRGDIVDVDVCMYNIKKYNPDIIFHMAAQPLVRKSYTDPLTTFNTNVIGTANILEAARECESVATMKILNRIMPMLKQIPLVVMTHIVVVKPVLNMLL